MANSANIFSGITAAGADGMGLAWFANTGSTAPTNSTAGLDAAFKNTGMITEDGLTVKFAESQKKIKGYGSPQVQRVLTTDVETSFDFVFLETNQYSMAVFHRLPITSITPTPGTGAFSATTGNYTRQQYAAVFDMIDGTNHIRAYCPAVEVTSRSDVKFSNGNETTWPVSCTAYPNTSGVAIQWYFLMSALA